MFRLGVDRFVETDNNNNNTSVLAKTANRQFNIQVGQAHVAACLSIVVIVLVFLVYFFVLDRLLPMWAMLYATAGGKERLINCSP